MTIVRINSRYLKFWTTMERTQHGFGLMVGPRYGVHFTMTATLVPVLPSRKMASGAPPAA